MPSERSSELKFEIGHVLFIDIVGYSKLLINEQSDQIQKLKTVVRGTEQVRIAEAEGKLLRLPTGDGGALVFRNNPEAPVLCAMEINRELQKHPGSKEKPQLRLRMGVHSGPVNEVTDLNEQANIAGAGINIAQRVMDCGDAGHILLSKRVAEDLAQYRQWQPLLHDLGEVEVKHGVCISIFNLHTGELGNPELPEKLRSAKPKEATEAAARREEGFWVAVSPLKYVGANADLSALAESLSEDIVTGLSRFSYLRVIARSSTLPFAKDSGDVRALGKELGARYVMEGSLRQAGAKLRLAVQLVDAVSGAHLWAENYERTFSPETIFELQDDLVPRIVSTVADQYGALVHSMSESLRDRSVGQYSPHEAVLRAFGYQERMTPEEHAEVRDILEAAVAVAPDHSDCLAELASIYWHEYAFGYNLRPDPIGRARAAAQRAVASAPTSHFAHCAFATALFFQKDYLAFRAAAERALALNRMDSSTAAILGNMIAYAGDWEYGRGIVERAMQLNPHHAGWYHYVAFCDAYRRRDYRGALASVLKVNMPAYRWPHVYLAAVSGQLGEQQRARAALRELHALVPNFGATAREEFGKWLDPELTEHLLDGLHKAGLEISGEAEVAPAMKGFASGTDRAADGFWIAVLPFKYSGSTPDLTALADGLTEEIITGLSRFSYLKVIARSSTSGYANAAVDVRSAGKELGARYVMEGSLRQAGAKLRLTVQVVDTNSGTHLWAENYERAFSPEAVFELQDDLVSRIVSTIADMNGVLPRSMSEAVRSQTPDQLSPYEAVLRSFGYFERITSEDLAVARSGLELAVHKAPTYADAWAMLALLCVQDYAQGFELQADCLTNGLSAARRAVEVGPSNHLAYFSLAQALFFKKEFQTFRNAAERAAALNPMDGNTIAFVGELLTYAGDWERGLELSGCAKRLNPNHPGWYWFADFYNCYRQRDYRGAVNAALKVNLPRHIGMHFAAAAAYGQLGEVDAADKALQEVLKLRSEFATTARQLIERWWNPEYVEHLIEGWREAGLKIDGEHETATLPAGTAKSSGKIFSQEAFWVAVLPFKSSGGAEIESFAGGLSEDITTGLSRFPYLSVVARAAAARLKGRAGDERTLGAELGARYVVEGSIRKQGSSIRVSARLIDTETGAQLWAETYDRDLQVSSIFAVQDDVASRIVATVADSYGVLVNSMATLAAAKDDADLTPAEWQFQYFAYRQQITPSNHAALKKRLEAALERDQRRAEIWSCLAQMYVDAYAFGFQADPTDLDRALVAARRGVEFDRTNQFGLVSLAQAYFFRQDLAAFRPAAERAMAINPLNTDALGILGLLIVHTGEFERGATIVRHAMQLNPDHAGWMHFGPIWEHFHKHEYERALDHANQVDIPGLFWPYLVVAAANGHLGRRTEAEAAVRDLLAIDPDFAAHARSNIASWHFASGLLEPLLDGLGKAGLPADHRFSDRV